MRAYPIVRIALVTAIGLLAGCDHQPTRPQFTADAYVGPKLFFFRNSQLGLNSAGERTDGLCPISRAPNKTELPLPSAQEGAAGLAALTWLVDKGTDLLERFLEQRAKEYTASNTAKTHGVLPKNADSYLGCLAYAHGTFREAGAGEPVLRGWDAKALKDVGLAEAPGQYAEFWLYFVDDAKTQIAVQPVLFDFARSQARRISSDGRKDVVMTVTIGGLKNSAAKADQQAEKATLVSTAFAYRDLPVGARLGKATLKNLNIEAQPLGKDFLGKPVNFSVTVAETDDAGDILLKLGNALKKNDDKIDDKLVGALKKLLGME